MKILLSVAVIVLFLFGAVSAQAGYMGGYGNESPAPAAQKDDSSVTITSPKNGSTSSSTVTVTWILKKGSHADHVHLYLDGKNTGPKKNMDSYTLTGLAPGKHTIELRTATIDHVELGPSDSVTVVVK